MERLKRQKWTGAEWYARWLEGPPESFPQEGQPLLENGKLVMPIGKLLMPRRRGFCGLKYWNILEILEMSETKPRCTVLTNRYLTLVAEKTTQRARTKGVVYLQ